MIIRIDQMRKMAAVQQIGQNEFEKHVLQTETPVLVDFYTDWCGPCRIMVPVLEGLADQFAGRLEFFKVNIEENLQMAEQYDITSIPTLIIFKDGRVCKQQVGVLDRSGLEEMIVAVLEVDEK